MHRRGVRAVAVATAAIAPAAPASTLAAALTAAALAAPSIAASALAASTVSAALPATLAAAAAAAHAMAAAVNAEVRSAWVGGCGGRVWQLICRHGRVPGCRLLVGCGDAVPDLWGAAVHAERGAAGQGRRVRA